jgi:hypothetical protein
MKRKLIQKVIEAGVVPSQAVKLMKHWRMLDEDLPDHEKQSQTEQQLLAFVAEIAGLMEESSEMPEMRETLLDMTEATFNTLAQHCSVLVRRWERYTRTETFAVKDAHNCYVFKNDTPQGAEQACVGNVIIHDKGRYWITAVSPIYWGERLMFLRCSVREVPEAERHLLEESDAQVSNVRKSRKKR